MILENGALYARTMLLVVKTYHKYCKDQYF